jgi:predicted membrane protein
MTVDATDGSGPREPRDLRHRPGLLTAIGFIVCVITAGCFIWSGQAFADQPDTTATVTQVEDAINLNTRPSSRGHGCTEDIYLVAAPDGHSDWIRDCEGRHDVADHVLVRWNAEMTRARFSSRLMTPAEVLLVSGAMFLVGTGVAFAPRVWARRRRAK